MGEFTKEEFIRGSDNLGVSTIQGLKDRLVHLRKRFDDDDVFDDMYNFTFMWACVRGKRCSMQLCFVTEVCRFAGSVLTHCTGSKGS